MNITKRDGTSQKFDKFKIVNAVLAAFQEVDGTITDYAEIKAGNIADYVAETAAAAPEPLTIEEIQDLVEKGLMSTKRKDVAKAYILYREERTKERNKRSELIKEVGEKLSASNVQNQNANVDEYSFGGRKGEAASVLMKQYALDYCMSEMAKRNHLNNEIYTHDLDSYSIGEHNCLSIPFDDLLANGFNIRQTDIRPANSVNTAFQLLAVIFQIQSLQQFGGCSATHIDWTMVPYVRKSFYKHFKEGLKYLRHYDISIMEYYNGDLSDLNDRDIDIATIQIDDERYKSEPTAYQYALDMTEKEVKQAVEGMYHNLNSLQSRSGNQLPFTSLNYGTCTLPEGRMIIKALLEGSINGVGKHHKTPIFPCGIFQYMKGVNDKPGTPNYDLYRLALQSTAKRLYPNYANADWTGNVGYDKNDPRTYFSTMGCRTANGWDINHEEGQNGQLKDGRGNICPVTIILPTLAMESKEKTDEESATPSQEQYVEEFKKLLNQKIDEAVAQLIERFNYICSQPTESAKFMYENNVIYGYDGKTTFSALRHGTLAVGQLGLAEALQILIEKNHTTKEGMNLAKEIEQIFKDKCAEYKEKYKLNFGVYYTPAENLCYTAMTKFHKRWPDVFPNQTYFTNSMHIPVWEKVTPFEKINLESQLTGYSSAGCITYVELDGGLEKNIDALEQLVNYAMDKDIPYFAINIPNDVCLDCGFTGEFDKECPQCHGEHINHLRRVTGYLTGDYKTAFNKGKQDEVEDRFRHSALVEV